MVTQLLEQNQKKRDKFESLQVSATPRNSRPNIHWILTLPLKKLCKESQRQADVFLEEIERLKVREIQVRRRD